MFKAFLTFLVLLAGIQFYAAAQRPPGKEIQRLMLQLQKSNSDTNRVALLLQLAGHYAEQSPLTAAAQDSALFFAEQAYALSQALKFTKGADNSCLLQIKILLKKIEQRLLEKADGKAESVKIKELENRLLESTHKQGPAYEAAIYMELGDLYSSGGKSDAPQVIALYEKALMLFRQARDKKGESRALFEIADEQVGLGELEKAEKNLTACVGVLPSAIDQDKEFAYSLLGIVHTYRGNIDQGLKYGLEAERIAGIINDTSRYMAMLYDYIGVTYEAIRDYPSALQYYRKALAAAEKHEDIPLVYALSSNVAKLMAPKDLRGSIVFMEEIIKKYPLDAVNEDNVRIYIRLMNGHMGLRDYKKAQQYCDMLVALLEELPPASPLKMSIYSPVIQFFIVSKQYDEARKYLPAYQQMAEKAGIPNFLREIELRWFRVDSAQGNHLSAINHYQKFKAINDSLYTAGKAKEIAELQIRFETEKKDKDLELQQQSIALLTRAKELQAAISEKKDRDLELKEKDIALLTGQQQLQLAEAEKKDQTLQLKQRDINLLNQASLLKDARLQQTKTTRNIIIGGAAMLLLLLGVVYSRYRVKKKSSKEINDKNLALQQAVDEKEWLLKEIHHRVKNNLQTVVSLLESQSAYLQSDALQAIQDSQNRVHAMSLVHQKLYLTENVASIDMTVYLPELVNYLRDSFAAKDIHFSLHMAPVDLDVSQAIPIGLIVNEAITNSIKYAFPGSSNNRIVINLEREADKQMVLTIADNGVGLSSDFNTHGRSGLGLKLMKGLTEDIGGSFSIRSENGTIISVSFTANTLLYKAKEATHSKKPVSLPA